MEQRCFKSTTNADLNLYSLLPKNSPKGIIHITHGMVEHAGRYERFAHSCINAGYGVFSHDLRGHGKTKAAAAPLGRFAKVKGLELIIEDQNAIIDYIRKGFPAIPIICFGHSLGAIIALNFLFKYPQKVDAIAVWNKPESGLLAKISTLLLRAESLLRDPALQSVFAWKLSYGAWNAKFKPNRTVADWISQDEEEVDKYVADPLCGFEVSISMWLDVLEGAFNSGRKENLGKIQQDFPINLRSGSDDPCTNNGRDHKIFEKKLVDLGMTNLDSKILDNTRHESLNEWNRDKTTDGFISWQEKLF